MPVAELKPMTMREMANFTLRYQSAAAGKNKNTKLERLSNIANDLRESYQIIGSNDPVMTANQPELMSMYNTVLNEIKSVKEDITNEIDRYC